LDPITHALLGGLTADLSAKKQNLRTALWVGSLAAMAPDLDFVIHSSKNPLTLMLYHRQFTHSLIFIPVGGFLVGLILWLLNRRKHPLRVFLIAAGSGFATHCLLDACTTFGTQLFWPFSNQRVSWDVISIVDPIVTAVLLLGWLLTLLLKRRNLAVVFLSLTALYFTGGLLQRNHIAGLQQALATERGHRIEASRVLPGLGQLILWRSIYASDGRIYVDAIRSTPWSGSKIYPGESLARFDPASILLPPDSELEKDLKIFQWFADGWLGVAQETPLLLSDERLSTLPNATSSFFNAEISIDHHDSPLKRVRFAGSLQERWGILKKMLRGEDLESSPPAPSGLHY